MEAVMEAVMNDGDEAVMTVMAQIHVE